MKKFDVRLKELNESLSDVFLNAELLYEGAKYNPRKKEDALKLKQTINNLKGLLYSIATKNDSPVDVFPHFHESGVFYLPSLLRTERTKMGLTQKEMSKKFNISVGKIRTLENDVDRIRVNDLDLISKIFPMNFEWVLEVNNKILKFSKYTELLTHARKEAGVVRRELEERTNSSKHNINDNEAGRNNPLLSDIFHTVNSTGFYLDLLINIK